MAEEHTLLILPKGARGLDREGIPLNLATKEIHRAGTTTALNPVEMRLLFHLFKHPDEAQGHELLIKVGWLGKERGKGSVKTRMGIIRDKLGDNAKNPRIIETVSGWGYRFIGRLKLSGKKEFLARKEIEILEATYLGETKPEDIRWNLLFPPMVLSYCIDKLQKYLDSKERDTLPIFNWDAQLTIIDEKGRIKTHPSQSAKTEDARRHKGDILWSSFKTEIKKEPFRAIAMSTEKRGWISWTDSGYSLVYPPIHPRNNHRVCIAYFRKEGADICILEMHQELVTELGQETRANLLNILPERIKQAERYLE